MVRQSFGSLEVNLRQKRHGISTILSGNHSSFLCGNDIDLHVCDRDKGYHYQ